MVWVLVIVIIFLIIILFGQKNAIGNLQDRIEELEGEKEKEEVESEAF
jgi:hypothetical protein